MPGELVKTYNAAVADDATQRVIRELQRAVQALFVNGVLTSSTGLALTSTAGSTTITPTINSYYGDPNGKVKAPKGSLILNGSAGALHVNTDGNTAWTQLT